jgi:ketosteroid isomerase-like protein
MRSGITTKREKGDSMYTRVVVFVLALLSSGPLIASDKEDVLAVVHKWVDSFNKGDSASALALCADESTIIDDVSPYAWHGAGACKAWYKDLNAFLKKNNAVFDHTTVDKVLNFESTGDRAYTVVLASFTTKVKDAPQSEQGIWTFAMKKGGQGWRITGWTWASSAPSN